VLVALAATVLVLATASSIIGEIQQPARTWRWLFLLLLAALAALAAAEKRREAALPAPPFALGALLAGVAVVSAVWSPYPRLTVERSGTFVVGLLAAAAIAVCASADRRFARRVLEVLVGVSATVAVLGFAVLAYDRELAVQGSTGNDPSRLQGFGMNPNTTSLLYALTIPAAVWLAATARGRARLLWSPAAAVIAISLFASGSRGATIASFLGVLVVALLLGRTWPRRGALALAVVCVWAGGVVACDMRSLQPEFVAAVEPRGTPPDEQQPAGPGTGGTVTPGAGGAGEVEPRVVGLPNYPVPAERLKGQLLPFVVEHNVTDVYSHGVVRGDNLFQPAQTGIFKGSGRLAVWEGAFEQAWRRPLLGYGFGVEEQVFVDRYYSFEGSRPENSYLGWLLQLGSIGTLLFVAVGAAVALRLARGPRTPEAVAAGAGALAGFVVAALQSFPYSIGSIAALAFWVLLGVAAAPTPLDAEPRGHAARPVRREPAPPRVLVP